MWLTELADQMSSIPARTPASKPQSFCPRLILKKPSSPALVRDTQGQRTLLSLTPLLAPRIGDAPVRHARIFAPSDDLDTVSTQDIRGEVRDVYTAGVIEQVLVAALGVRNCCAVCSSTRRWHSIQHMCTKTYTWKLAETEPSA
jgi:hypothetical protein